MDNNPIQMTRLTDREAFQDRVAPWMSACFSPQICSDRVERGDRLVEEVFELLQAEGYDPARILSLREYVWARPVGEPTQEVGGVMVTLAAFCLAHGLNMHTAGETELTRIWTKVEKIRAKQASKPTGSALPIPVDDPLSGLRSEITAIQAQLAECVGLMREAADMIEPMSLAGGSAGDSQWRCQCCLNRQELYSPKRKPFIHASGCTSIAVRLRTTADKAEQS